MQLRFSLSSDDALHREHKRRSLFDNPGFFNCLLELATDPNSKRELNALLKWWDKYVYVLLSARHANLNHTLPLDRSCRTWLSVRTQYAAPWQQSLSGRPQEELKQGMPLVVLSAMIRRSDWYIYWLCYLFNEPSSSFYGGLGLFLHSCVVYLVYATNKCRCYFNMLCHTQTPPARGNKKIQAVSRFLI